MWTRRHALALGAAAGIGALIGEPARGAARAGSFSLALGADTFGDVVRPGRRFDLLGVAGGDLAGLQVRVRRAGGAWSRWTPIGAGAAHAPDGAPRRPGSDPVWTGAADELQRRGRPRALRLRFVAVGSAAPRTPRARAAQSGGGAPPIITREQWGALAPKATPTYGVVHMAFVHHTENANDYTAEESAGIVLAIQRYHQDHNGWNDIGYNFLVDRYGQVFEGRAGGLDQAVIGAQAEGWNSKSTGVATIGGFMTEGPPEEALSVLSRLIAWKLALHGVPATGTVTLASGGGKSNRYAYGEEVVMPRIGGHRDGCKTDCPGDVLYGQLDAIRSRAAALEGSIVTQPKLVLSAAATRVRYGDDAVFSGRLLGADGVPVSSARVSVQKQGSAGFVTLVAATTEADGAWRARVPWRRAGAVRAQAKVSGVSGAVRSPVVSVAIEPLLHVRVPAARSRMRAGRRVSVQGSVRPPAPVGVVVEKQGKDGDWHRVRVERAQVRGRQFSAAIRLRTPGLYRLTTQTEGARAPARYVRAVRSEGDVGGVAADA